MEKKTIAMLVAAALILIAGIVLACGIGRGDEVTYQQPGPYTAERSNEFSDVQVAMTIQGDQILDAAITSSGDNDLLTDEIRAEWADSIVANQSYENDVISSASLKISAASVREAAADIFTQAGLPTPEPAATPEPEPEPEPEAPADETGTQADDNFHVEKTTDFSTIDVGITVEEGKITDASVASAPLEGQVDLLTDDIRSAWARQIVEKQAVDAVSGVTISSDAVQEAVEQLMVQVAGGGEPAANDLRIAELEAALADAEARAEAAEARATELETANAAAEAKVAELEDAAAALAATGEAQPEAEDAVEIPATESGHSDISRFVRPRPTLSIVNVETEDKAEEAPAAESADADISRFVRPRPTLSIVNVETEDKAEEVSAAEAAEADISRFVRPRPVPAVVNTETEAEAEEASAAEAADADISRFVRPRPASAAVSVETEADTEEAPATEATDPDISRLVRPRPGSAAASIR